LLKFEEHGSFSATADPICTGHLLRYREQVAKSLVNA
jgi:hypothetical protein